MIRAEGNARTAMMDPVDRRVPELRAGLAVPFQIPLGDAWRGGGHGIGPDRVGPVGAGLLSQGQERIALSLASNPALQFHGPTCRRILLIGSPMFAMMLFGALMFGCVNYQAGKYGRAEDFGYAAIAVWGSIYALVMMSSMPVYGVNQGTQPIVGFNYGAKRFDRVKQALLTGILYASALTVFGFLVAMLIPGPLMGLFINAKTPNRSALIDMGVHAMRLCFLLSPLVGFQVVSASYFQATGKPREATLLMLSRQVFLLIPLVLILPQVLPTRRRVDGTADLRRRVVVGDRRVPPLRTPPPRQPPSRNDRRKSSAEGMTLAAEEVWPVPEDVMAIGDRWPAEAQKNSSKTSGLRA